jgi:glutamate carboxypeptidase
MNHSALTKHLYSKQTEMLDSLESLVNRESPSTEKHLLDLLAEQLKARFQERGAECLLLESATHGNHVQASFPPPGSTESRPGLILCHYDTVWPPGTLSSHPFRVEGKRAWGPGIFDMKASIVMVEYAMRAMHALGMQLPRRVNILLTSDEEISSPSSRALIEHMASEAEYVLVMEPPSKDGALKTARKGIGKFILEINGRAAHAGTQPEQGVSATHELAYQILNLHNLNDPEQGTTINVGVVGGGTRRNVIAAQAFAEVDVRAWTPEEARRITQAVLNLKPHSPGAELQIRGGFVRPPMERNHVNAELFRRARDIGKGLGLDLEESATGGGSDANFTAALGVPTLDGLGAIGNGAHADDEHIRVDLLPMRTALLAALLLNL